MPVLIYLAFLAVGVGSWATHIFRCFTEGEWGFLIAGALIAPLACIHGIGIWFGWW